MGNDILTYLVTNVSFGTLFVWLLFDTRKDSKQREEKYQNTIEGLVDTVGVVKEIKIDVQSIKVDVEDLKKDRGDV